MNNKYNKYFIISGTSAMIIIFAFLIVEIYTRTLDDAKRDYQQQQLEMTRIVAHGIKFFIEHLINDIESISSSSQNNDFSYLENYLTSNNPVQSIFKSDKKGNILFELGKPLPYWTPNFINQKFNSSTKQESIFLSEVNRSENSDDDYNLVFHLISRTFNDKKGSENFIGFVINFNILVDEYIKPLKLNKEDFAWVMDGNGRLIYHPNHKEMLLNSIGKTNDKCFDCHTSFSKQKMMLSVNQPFIDEYKVIVGESPKIIAYQPIYIENQKCILVISTMLTKVTETLRNRFAVFFIIGIVILFVILFFSFLIYYINAKRIRAEESKRNLEKIHNYRDQLNQASKLASIGELVDTFAHEINTPAGIIAAHVDGLCLQNKIPDEITPEINIIKKQIKRISDYTRTLLGYSQRMDFNLERVNLKELVDECIYILSPKFRYSRVKIEKHYEENLYVEADSGQLQQVIINLLINAIDAIKNAGIIKIKIEKNFFNKEDGVLISIEDNGSGIPSENVDKIFTAFYSTKQKDKGTGLGLYISKAIILRHKGNINVKPSTSGGSIFEVFLPFNNQEDK